MSLPRPSFPVPLSFPPSPPSSPATSPASHAALRGRTFGAQGLYPLWTPHDRPVAEVRLVGVVVVVAVGQVRTDRQPPRPDAGVAPEHVQATFSEAKML